MYMYVFEYDMYVHVCIMYILYLWIHSMKVSLRHIERITSGMHDALRSFDSHSTH